MTQRDLAGDALSVSYVSLLESGRRQPTPATVELLAQALSCDVADLLAPAADTAAPTSLLLTQADLALRAGHATAAHERYEQVLDSQPSDVSLRLRATVAWHNRCSDSAGSTRRPTCMRTACEPG